METQENLKVPEREKLSVITKIGFGMGDLYGGGSLIIVGILYLIFLTDIIMLRPSLAGIVILISKIWDAASDPLMGYLSDRTRTRFGRRRPYFLAGIFLIFLSFFLMWYPIDFDQELHRFIYVLLSYLFFSTVITMVMIPYNAMASELTLDYNERSSLTSVRMIFSMLSTAICAILPLEVIKLFAIEKDGYMAMSIVFGLFFALPFIATFLVTKERPEFQKEIPKLELKESFVQPFKMRSFRNVLMMYLFAFLSLDVIMAIVIYFMTYYMNRAEETNYIMGAILLPQLIAIPLYYYISKKTSKRTAYLIGAFIWLILMLFSFIITPDSHNALIYIFGACVGMGTSGVIVMVYSMFPDIPDVDELRTGERREGTYAGLLTFMRKFSAAIAIFLISLSIDLSGYIPSINKVMEDARADLLDEELNIDEFQSKLDQVLSNMDLEATREKYKEAENLDQQMATIQSVIERLKNIDFQQSDESLRQTLLPIMEWGLEQMDEVRIKPIITQGETFIIVLRILFAIPPILLLIICIINAIRYPLSPQRHERLRKLLEQRRQGKGPLSEEWAAEERELKQQLIG